MHGKLFIQLSWLPSRSRYRSWVNDCICRQQLLEVTQKQNMLLIPATCNGQICRRRIKYACDPEPEPKQESVMAALLIASVRRSSCPNLKHKVRATKRCKRRLPWEEGGVINFATAFETNTTGHGRMRKRHLVMDFLPVRWMRLTFCGQPAVSAPQPGAQNPIGNSHSASTHTSSTLIFQFQRILDRQADWQAVRLDYRQTDGQSDRQTALLSVEAEVSWRVVDCFAMISLRNRKHQMRQIVQLQKDVFLPPQIMKYAA